MNKELGIMLPDDELFTNGMMFSNFRKKTMQLSMTVFFKNITF